MNLTDLGLGLKYMGDAGRQYWLDIERWRENQQVNDLRNMQIAQAKREEALRVQRDAELKMAEEEIKRFTEEQEKPLIKTIDKTPILSKDWGVNKQLPLIEQIQGKFKTGRYENVEIPRPKGSIWKIRKNVYEKYPTLQPEFQTAYNIANGEDALNSETSKNIVDAYASLVGKGYSPEDAAKSVAKIYPNQKQITDELEHLKIEKDEIKTRDLGGDKIAIFTRGSNGKIENVKVIETEKGFTPQTKEFRNKEGDVIYVDRNKPEDIQKALTSGYREYKDKPITATGMANLAHQLRGEIKSNPYVKDFQDINNKYSVMQKAFKKSKDSKNFIAIDQAIISLFNKMTDPQSVVRESEYIRTPQNQSIIDRFKGAVSKYGYGGAGIAQEDRQALIEMANEFHNSYAKNYDDTINNFKELARETGISEKLIGIPYDRPNQLNKTDDDLNQYWE